MIGWFFASGNTCPHCQAVYQASCRQREFVSSAQAPILRVPLADGTLVATAELPSKDLIPSLLALSDVMGTGWFAADAANLKPGSTVAVGSQPSRWAPASLARPTSLPSTATKEWLASKR